MSSLDEKQLPEAVDLRHHLSDLAKARPLSPLKGLQKYWGRPGLISLAGGLPHPELFPYASVSADLLTPTSFPVDPEESTSPLSWLWNIFSSSSQRTEVIGIPKYGPKAGDLDLANILQYSMASGHPKYLKFNREFTAKVFKPAYSDWQILAHVGNTDGWMKAVLTLCNPGEGVLADVWTYPSAMACMKPYGIQAVPVSMDYEGMRPDALRELLSNWDASARGIPRPHVMYTVPIGQNPTGATMGISRKKEIYAVCVEFDVIIVEDDPYYFLQEGTYQPARNRDVSQKEQSPDDFLTSLTPSYLRIDYQGRVIRLDTFSKTLAPGCRLGWFTCNKLFAERLERQAETSTAAPSGFSQAIVTTTLDHWGYDGYVRWLQGLQRQYIVRRDFLLDCFVKEFDLDVGKVLDFDAFSGCDVYFARPKHQAAVVMMEKSRPYDHALFSFVPPTSGMFLWIKLNLEQHPKRPVSTINDLELELWEKLADAGVLFGPGNMFAATAEEVEKETTGHFRISFSNAEFDDLKKAVSIFAKTIVAFFKE